MIKKSFAALLALGVITSVAADTIQVVQPTEESQKHKFAVTQMTNMLRKALGKAHTVKLVDEKNITPGKAIHINTAEAFKVLPQAAKLGKRQWLIKSQNNNIYIAGTCDTGVLYGVWDYLNMHDIYNIAPGAYAVPQLASVKFDNLDKHGKMAFARAHAYPGMYPQLKLRDKTAKNERQLLDQFLKQNHLLLSHRDLESPFYHTPSVTECHSLYSYVPPKVYSKTHPEYFQLNKAGRRIWIPTSQLCFSNPDVRKIAAEAIIKRIEQDRKKFPNDPPTLYDFSQNDSPDLCACKSCRDLSQKYGGDAGLLLDMVNEIAGIVGKKYPDVYIQTFAYLSTKKPVDTIKPAKNVIIKFCDAFGPTNNCYLPITRQPQHLEPLKKYIEIAPNLYLWDYWNMAGYMAVAPGTIIDAVVEDLRYFHKIGLKALFLEAEIGTARPQSFIYMQYFVAGQMLKNPAVDTEKLIDIYIKNYYGPVADDMRKYFDFMRAAIKKDPVGFNARTPAMDFLKQASAMLEEAAKKVAGDPIYEVRVLHEKNVVDYALITRLNNVATPGIDLPNLIKIYAANMRTAINKNPLVPAKVKKDYLNEVDKELLLWKLDYALPAELKDAPADRIVRLPHNGVRYFNICRVLKDPLSDMPDVYGWYPTDPKDYKLPFSIGFWDIPSGRQKGTRIYKLKANDEKYHWYRIGTFRIGRETRIWATGRWHISLNLKSLYVNDEYVPPAESPNNYDVYVSIRFAGPAYNPGSKSDNGVFIDKIALVRTQAVFGDLPAELKDVPAEKIHKVPAKNLVGKKVTDYDSPMCQSAALANVEKMRDKFIHAGVYLFKEKKYPVGRNFPIAKDEKYHWVKLGTGKTALTESGQLYLGNWTVRCHLKDFAFKDKENIYDYWISVKLQGPKFVPGSTKPNGVFLDRVVLVEKNQK